MKENICKSCKVAINENDSFCYNCGKQVKCKVCAGSLEGQANYCPSCGVIIKKASDLNQNKNLNKISIKENKIENVYEVYFTNELSFEIKDVITDLLKTKFNSSSVSKLPNHDLLNENKDSTEILIEPVDQVVKVREVAETQNLESQETKYPHLNDLEINIQATEAEWLLLYAFYKSDFGAIPVKKETVWNFYKEKRKTETRFKNLGTNWKTLFKKYIQTVKENEFKLTLKGLAKVEQLISNVGKAYKKVSRSGDTNTLELPLNATTLARKTSVKPIPPDEFDSFKSENKESLESFFNRMMPGYGTPNRVITIAYYITKINKQSFFTEGNIDYAYRLLKLSKKPVHLKQIIINLKNERLWFQKATEGDKKGWKLTRQGELFVEDKLPHFS